MFRPCPAVTISHCDNVTMENVTIHAAGGMGFIAQISRDVTLRGCRVAPAGGRMVSLRADATHFVCCSGEILLEDCEFSHQLDDPGNFHNVYLPVVRKMDARTLLVRLFHHQQRGLQPFAAGQEVEFLLAAGLQTVGRAVIAEVTPLNKEHFILRFAKTLPEGIGPGWAVGTPDIVAHVTIRRTSVHSNRARGFLFGTSGRNRVEDCHFHFPGAAIHLSGDAKSWHEAGPVHDLLIQNNVFEDCNFGVWGRATMELLPQIAEAERPAARYHRNIRVEGNTFHTFHPRLLYSRCSESIFLRNNTIHLTAAYSPEPWTGTVAECEFSDGITVENSAPVKN